MVKSLSRVEWLKSLLSPNWATWQNQRLENGSGAIKYASAFRSRESSHELTYINIPKLKLQNTTFSPIYCFVSDIFKIYYFSFIYTSRMPSVCLWMSNLALFPIEMFSAEMIYRDFFFLFWRRWNRTDQVHSQHICFLWWLPIHKCPMIYLIYF